MALAALLLPLILVRSCRVVQDGAAVPVSAKLQDELCNHNRGAHVRGGLVIHFDSDGPCPCCCLARHSPLIAAQIPRFACRWSRWVSPTRPNPRSNSFPARTSGTPSHWPRPSSAAALSHRKR